MGGPVMVGFRRDRESIRGKKIERALLVRIVRYARAYRAQVIAFLVTVIGIAIVSNATPLLFKALIDRAILKRKPDLVTVLGAIALGLALTESLLRLAQRWFSARVGEGLIYDLRVDLFDHVQRMPIEFFTHSQTGALMSRLNNDVIGAQRAVTTTLGSLTQNTFVLLLAIPVMMTLEPRLTLLMLAVLPGFLILSRMVGHRLQAITKESMQHNAAMNNVMSERFNVAGALIVKLFGRYRRERDGFAERASGVRDIGIRSAMLNQYLVAGLSLVVALGTVVVFWFGGRMAANGTISTGSVVAFAWYVGRVYQPLIQLTNARVDLLTALVSFERVFEVLDLPQRVADAPDAVPLPTPAQGRVEFRDVHFTYPTPADAAPASLDESTTRLSTSSSGEVLRGVSFVAEPGQMVALVGPSGAGKTTIVTLLSRLYDVDDGAVLVDDHDVRELQQESLRGVIAVVPQDPHLFHDTVRQNLRYARADASDDDIEQACRQARIHDTIQSLPDGYETVVGERGYRFSGGEKQRIAIARALLKDPAIIILDEATSHLDSETESLIQAAFAEALRGRTALVIAHRLSTVVAADQILVVDSGRIVERGRHGALLQGGQLYSDLYRTQFDRNASNL